MFGLNHSKRGSIQSISGDVHATNDKRKLELPGPRNNWMLNPLHGIAYATRSFSIFLQKDIMTNNEGITQTIGNIARAATTIHRHSRRLSSTTALPVPPPPQHTNVSTHHQNQPTNAHSHRLSVDCTATVPANVSQSPVNASPIENRRVSLVGLTAEDGLVNNINIEFDGGTHVIVRPNRVIRGMYFLRKYAPRLSL